MTIFFLINLSSSLFLCGLIWMIQVVHYPIFHRLEKEEFISHMEFHQRKISFVVIPVMMAELITSGVLSFFSEQFQILHITGLILVLLVWVATFFYSVPLHSALMDGYSRESVNKLCSTNRIRVFLWTAKAVLSLYILFSLM